MRNCCWFGLIALLSLAGCGGSPAPEREAKPPAARPVEVPAGTIVGKVAFDGEKPVLMPISMDAVPACAKQHPMVIESEQVVVNGNGTLRNVFVHLKTGVPVKDWPMPAEPVLLDQKGCIYTPRVIAVRVGQTLEIGNADPMMHNVHPLARRNEEWNVAQPPQGERMRKQFANPEVMIPFVCNMHPWMKAFVSVVEHPFYAVTGADGSFRFAGVPPGEYEIEAVHEHFGAKTLTVTVGSREERSVQIHYRSN